MNTKFKIHVDEVKCLENIQKCLSYSIDAVQNKDYYSASLEAQDLICQIQRLEKLEIKKQRREKLENLIKEMNQKGIKIDLVKKVIS